MIALGRIGSRWRQPGLTEGNAIALASSVSTAACQLIEPEARGGSHARRHDGHGTPSDHEG
ncbi:hypothetical protein GCM10023191_078450 [Actinoallomurus oryzae]|uniref:Uncharacterized protein n=1 Tax=Actinoallomurus oryzae TaxID=502180 RepID=A0ABP8QXI2_9ACTN